MLKATIEVIEGYKVVAVDNPTHDIKNVCKLCCFGPLLACGRIPCIPRDRADNRNVFYVELLEEGAA